MRVKIAALAGTLALLAAPVFAYEPVAYPGSTWGALTRDIDGLEGWGAQGSVKQGVTWLRLPLEVDVNTFAAYRWRFRSENRPFYNAQGPAVSLEFTKGFLDAGLDFSWQRFPELRETSDQYELFVGWYKRLDLAKGGVDILGARARGLPLTTWGRVAHDLNGLEGDGTQGWVSQAVEWCELPRGLAVVKTFAAYRWRLRDKNRTFYNVHGPAVGVELSRGPVDVGLEHAWRRYPGLSRSDKAISLYADWYFGWDLKRR